MNSSSCLLKHKRTGFKRPVMATLHNESEESETVPDYSSNQSDHYQSDVPDVENKTDDESGDLVEDLEVDSKVWVKKDGDLDYMSSYEDDDNEQTTNDIQNLSSFQMETQSSENQISNFPQKLTDHVETKIELKEQEHKFDIENSDFLEDGDFFDQEINFANVF